MPPVDRLRSLPGRRAAIGAASVALLVVIVVAAALGADADEVTTAPATAPTTTVALAPTTSPATTTSGATTTSSATTTSTPPTTVTPSPADVDEIADRYDLDVDVDDPAVAGRPIPDEAPVDEPPPTTLAPPPWAASERVTEGGQLAVDVGCLPERSTAALDRFLGGRVGPVLGWDYQHVYPLGGDRYLWLFQDAFVDHSGTATTLGSSRFVHNAAMVQEGGCFRLLHGGTSARPQPFEAGDGSGSTRTKWYWPMGGELVGDRIWVFWAEMVKDPYDPLPPDGLGWHPNRTFLASYDARTLARRSFALAPASGVTPIYGYAVASDPTHTYLFGNTFEQNLVREGGFWNGPHSATNMWLARVPRGQLAAAPEYRTADGWSPDPAAAVPIVSRFFAENPMQPRYLDGQWVATTAVDGYWGDHLAVDLATDPWGPWTTVRYDPLLPRGADPKMNTYHAQPLPWRDGYGSVLVTVSNNARNMVRDAWPRPDRYRPTVVVVPYQPTPPPPTTTVPPTTTLPPTTSTTSTSTSTSSTTSTTSTSTTTPPTTTSTPTSSSTTTSTSSTSTLPPGSTTSTTTSTTTPTTSSTTTPTSAPLSSAPASGPTGAVPAPPPGTVPG